jgi:hypothetical protein
MGKAVREATGITIQLAYYFESSQAHLRRNLGYSSIFDGSAMLKRCKRIAGDKAPDRGGSRSPRH